MTSINIQATTDRSNFINFFSDPITIPKNTQIAMSKAFMKIPVYVNTEVRVPEDILQGDNAFRVEIDGISEDITWGNLYDAHTQLPGIETFNNFTDWRNNYIYLPNNQVLFYDNNTNSAEVKTDFNTILARAITNKMSFYVVSPAPKYKNILEDRPDVGGQGTTITQVTGGNTYTFTASTNNYLEALGFNVEYAPIKMFGANQTFVNINLAENDRHNWIQGAALHSLRGATGVCCAYMGQMDFDYNGGYIHTLPNLATGNANGLISFGLQFVGVGNSANDRKKAFSTGYDRTMYDIGVEFGFDGTNNVFNIITKANQFNSTTDTSILHSKLEPHRKVNGFDNNGDHFFIQIARSNELHNSDAWVVNILQGVSIDPETDPSARIVYSETFNFNPQTEIIPLFQANVDAGTDAWEFNNIAYIPRTDQTIEQGDLALQGNHNLGTFLIEPHIEHNRFASTYTCWDFWNAWGLFNNNIFPLDDKGGRSRFFVSVEGNNRTRLWENPTNLQAATTTYIIGDQDFNNTYHYLPIVNNDFLVLNPFKIIQNLPQVINVSVNNIDIKNFSGTLPYGSIGAGSTQDTSSGDSKVVGTIPFPADQINNSSLITEIAYEPFNLLYRPINNPNIQTINQINVELFYRDFITKEKKNLDGLIGTANVEFHIRSGGTPAPPNKAGLRPY